MQKKYIVRLTDQERVELRSVVKKLKGTGQKVRRAQILLKADADGPNWTDEGIADAFSCRTRTVERLRQRLVERGFEETLHRVERVQPPVEKLLTGDQEARIIATRLGSPPKGYANWTLRLLARKVVELKIVDSVSYETVRRTLTSVAQLAGSTMRFLEEYDRSTPKVFTTKCGRDSSDLAGRCPRRRGCVSARRLGGRPGGRSVAGRRSLLARCRRS